LSLLTTVTVLYFYCSCYCSLIQADGEFMQALCDKRRVSFVDIVATYHNGVWGSCDGLMLEDWVDAPLALAEYMENKRRDKSVSSMAAARPPVATRRQRQRQRRRS
jgi:hypothetical protein